MRKLISLCISLCAIVLLISVCPVRAQNVLWVANNGNDANVCSQAAPCLTFQGAINKGSVAQINCLTSGNFGSFTIAASITVDCGTGNVGTIAVAANIPAISILANSAATIVLRHLSLNGLGTAAFGINTGIFPSGTLVVEDCVIQGFKTSIGGGVAINFIPTAGRGLLQVSNSQILNNSQGIEVGPQNGQIASVTLSRVELVGNSAVGLSLFGGVVAGTMRESVVSANGVGVFLDASQAFFTIEESSLVANVTAGIVTDTAGTIVNVGASTIGGNGTGVLANAGSIISFGNNQMSVNGTNGNFTGTTALR
jgi:hypothetical protein